MMLFNSLKSVETEKKFKQAGFEKRTFQFNGQTGEAYSKLTEDYERINITNQNELTCPTTMDDPIRVYIVVCNKDDENKLVPQTDFFILNEATDHPTAQDYFESIEHEVTQPVITFCPACFAMMSNDPITFEISPYQLPDNTNFNEINQALFDKCKCEEDFIYLDEITKINLLIRVIDTVLWIFRDDPEISMTKEEIAIKFSAELLKEIGMDNLIQVNQLNSKETNSQICHSHDFTDANQIMLDVVGNPEDVENIWDEVSPAWTLAKKNNFYIK